MLVAAIGSADYVTGTEISVSSFYLIPIVIVAWFAGMNAGLGISVISAITWFIADVLGGQSYSNPIIRYWNAAVRLSFFVLVTILIPALKAVEHEKLIARTDDLTGIANRRQFFEVLQSEVNRSQRYKRPFTIVYIDLDNFKAVNDQMGHEAGDKLLCAIADRTKSFLRTTDIMARLGGDEFAILLPELGQDPAPIVVPKIQHALLEEMQRNDWPVTFSVGALTCRDASVTADRLISRADELMYSVKKNGKNAIAYAIYAG
jgi:diguanylate cyclase (GGDEF)-like protein